VTGSWNNERRETLEMDQCQHFEFYAMSMSIFYRAGSLLPVLWREWRVSRNRKWP